MLKRALVNLLITTVFHTLADKLPCIKLVGGECSHFHTKCIQFMGVHVVPVIRGEPERAPNTRETGSGFICIYIIHVCGVIISVRRELNFERVR